MVVVDDEQAQPHDALSGCQPMATGALQLAGISAAVVGSEPPTADVTGVPLSRGRRATVTSDVGFLGSPYGIRTRAATLRGWCPRPLDERAEQRCATLAALSDNSHGTDPVVVELGREESNP